MSATNAVTLALLLLPLFTAGCRKPGSRAPQPAAVAAAAPAEATAVSVAPAAAARASIQGTVEEKIDVAQYSYLRLKTADGEVWAAVPKTDKAVGAKVGVVNAMWMEKFASDTLNRTWDRIAFGMLEGATPSGHPSAATPAGAGLLAKEGAEANPHTQPGAQADASAVSIVKFEGTGGHTVGEVWAQKTELKDKRVAVRGKVVKATNGVLGKNWLHLRDGTGEGTSGDLAVTTAQTSSVGDVVVVTGPVHLDRDFGAGYRYDVIVEDAEVTKQ